MTDRQPPYRRDTSPIYTVPHMVGGRYSGPAIVKDGWIESDNYVAGSAGWRINAAGDVEFESGDFRGDITGASGTFTGDITGATGTFSGAVEATSIDIGGSDASSWHVDSDGNMWWGASGSYATASIRISSAGSVDFVNGTFSGTLNNAGGSLSSVTGSLNGVTGTFSGQVTAGSIDIPNTTNTNSFHVASDGDCWLGSNTASQGSAKIRLNNDGTATFASDVTISGDLTVSGATTLSSAFEIDGGSISSNTGTPYSRMENRTSGVYQTWGGVFFYPSYSSSWVADEPGGVAGNFLAAGAPDLSTRLSSPTATHPTLTNYSEQAQLTLYAGATGDSYAAWGNINEWYVPDDCDLFIANAGGQTGRINYIGHNMEFTSWTPTAEQLSTSITVSSHNCNYFRIGHLVVLTMHMIFSTSGVSGQALEIRGIPTNAEIVDEKHWGGHVTLINPNTSPNTWYGLVPYSDGTNLNGIRFYPSWGAQTTAMPQVANSWELRGTMVYANAYS